MVYYRSAGGKSAPSQGLLVTSVQFVVLILMTDARSAVGKRVGRSSPVAKSLTTMPTYVDTWGVISSTMTRFNLRPSKTKSILIVGLRIW